jgi:hypothetical protein
MKPHTDEFRCSVTPYVRAGGLSNKLIKFKFEIQAI